MRGAGKYNHALRTRAADVPGRVNVNGPKKHVKARVRPWLSASFMVFCIHACSRSLSFNQGPRLSLASMSIPSRFKPLPIHLTGKPSSMYTANDMSFGTSFAALAASPLLSVKRLLAPLRPERRPPPMLPSPPNSLPATPMTPLPLLLPPSTPLWLRLLPPRECPCPERAPSRSAMCGCNSAAGKRRLRPLPAAAKAGTESALPAVSESSRRPTMW
mmetsp:Transcript_72752/g.210648  ORF Transcript_72752/g.210648 Transcript_72752/m.210648 type:complete len:216 (-) Transcript_72752:30-677(-)